MTPSQNLPRVVRSEAKSAQLVLWMLAFVFAGVAAFAAWKRVWVGVVMAGIFGAYLWVVGWRLGCEFKLGRFSLPLRFSARRSRRRAPAWLRPVIKALGLVVIAFGAVIAITGAVGLMISAPSGTFSSSASWLLNPVLLIGGVLLGLVAFMMIRAGLRVSNDWSAKSVHDLLGAAFFLPSACLIFAWGSHLEWFLFALALSYALFRVTSWRVRTLLFPTQRADIPTISESPKDSNPAR